MALWPDLQYCKTDLISAKGVVFCKFARSSAALRCMEAVNETCMVSRPGKLPVVQGCPAHIRSAAWPTDGIACLLRVLSLCCATACGQCLRAKILCLLRSRLAQDCMHSVSGCAYHLGR